MSSKKLMYYLSPGIQKARTQLADQIFSYARAYKLEVVLGSDMNAHSTLWGYGNTDGRGRAFESFIVPAGVIIKGNRAPPPLGMPRGASTPPLILLPPRRAFKYVKRNS